MSDKSEAIFKLVSAFLTGLLTFLVDWAILKWGWDSLLVHLFPSLPTITWMQALVLWMICGVLFKQRTVEVREKKI